MSLVEKALRKLKDTQTPGELPEPASTSGGVPDFSARVSAGVRSAPLTARRSDKRIVIDRAALRAAGLMPPEEHARRTGSEYRRIKRPLIAAAFGKGAPQVPKGHLIMVASAMPGDGKTFTSVNLALCMALEKDLEVVLVDADLAKPHISRTFGVEGEPGLLDVLRDPVMDVESVIIPTDVPSLGILPAGRFVDTATELLASARMDQVMSDLGSRGQQRIVILDSPPLLLTSESRALAEVVGQVVIVVRAGGTEQQAVLEAINSVGEGKSVGLVLNQSEQKPANDYYGYGYGANGPATS